MFIIYPQATQTRHLTVDNRQTRLIDFFLWKIAFIGTFWAQIASIFDGFMVLIRLSNLLLFFFDILIPDL